MATLPSPPLPLLLLLLLLQLPHLAAPAPTYDALCESIVAHATTAAQAHNQGRDTASAIAAALGAFDAAVAVDATEAQAYIYVANFLFNIHRFDASLERWRQALDRLRAARPPQPQYIAMVEGRIKETRFGDLSTRRDAVYADGQGNMTAAVALVERQLAVYRSPRILADLATLQSMLAEVHGAPTAAVSAQQFAAAQRAAAWGAAAFQRAQAGRGRGGKCPAAATLHDVDALSSATGSRGGSSGGSGGSSEDLGGFRQVVVTSAGSSTPDLSAESAEVERGLSAAYTARFAAPATAASPPISTATTTTAATAATTTDVFIGAVKKARLSGPDGVITRSKKCALHVYGTTEWPHVALHGSLWLGETWKSNASQEFSVYDHSLAHRYPPPHPGQLPPAIDRAASIVGFTSTNFFHFVMAAMPRLVALLPLLRKAASTAKPVRLIVPEQQNRGFVDAFLERAIPHDLWPEAVAGAAPAGESPRARLARWRKKKLVIAYDVSLKPGARFIVGQLYWADWKRVAVAPADAHAGVPTHCLTSPRALVAARAHLWAAFQGEAGAEAKGGAAGAAGAAGAVGVEENGNKVNGAGGGVGSRRPRPAVIYTTRGTSSMRRLTGEETLVEALREMVGRVAGGQRAGGGADEDQAAGRGSAGDTKEDSAAAAAAAVPEFVVFDGGKMSTAEAVALFSRAAVVVGVHGAALANILFSPSSALLVELGFKTPTAVHYEQSALALGIAYHKELLDSDEHSVAAKYVGARSGVFEGAVAAAERHLKRPVGRRGGAGVGSGGGHSEL